MAVKRPASYETENLKDLFFQFLLLSVDGTDFVQRIEPQKNSSHNIFFVYKRQNSKPAVGGIIPVVSHDKDFSRRHHHRIIVLSMHIGGNFFLDIGFIERQAIYINSAVFANIQRLPPSGDHPFNQRLIESRFFRKNDDISLFQMCIRDRCIAGIR